ncbi:FAS1-like dehydratase domain-containing protein [Actinomycetospora sp. C-140]
MRTTWDPVEYAVGREKIQEFVSVIGERHAVFRSAAAAREAGYRDVVAPPMFAVVYAGSAVYPAVFDPRAGIDTEKMLHVGQRFAWGEPVCAGDTVTTETEIADVSSKGRNTLYVFASVSRNQADDEVVRGRWTMMVRG